MVKEFSILDWDSGFFGYRVGTILPTTLDTMHLELILEALRRENVALAYWPSNSESRESEIAGNSLGGFLADRKTTYFLDLEELEENSIPDSHLVLEYKETTSSEELEQLAIQSGEYSRFNLDPRIPTERFTELYRIWIQKAVSKIMADAVMVIPASDNKVAGMITLGEKNGRGDIGLIAVNACFRGKGYGRALVGSALRFFLSEGYKHAQVVTQGDNVPACRLFEGTAYTVEKCENVFHFWLS